MGCEFCPSRGLAGGEATESFTGSEEVEAVAAPVVAVRGFRRVGRGPVSFKRQVAARFSFRGDEGGAARGRGAAVPRGRTSCHGGVGAVAARRRHDEAADDDEGATVATADEGAHRRHRGAAADEGRQRPRRGASGRRGGARERRAVAPDVEEGRLLCDFFFRPRWREIGRGQMRNQPSPPVADRRRKIPSRFYMRPPSTSS